MMREGKQSIVSLKKLNYQDRDKVRGIFYNALHTCQPILWKYFIRHLYYISKKDNMCVCTFFL